MLRRISSLPSIIDALVPFPGASRLAPRPRAEDPPSIAGLSAGTARRQGIDNEKDLRSSTRVEISPSAAAERLWVKGPGIVVELVHAIGRIDFRYRGSSHLLVAYEQGLGREGDESVDSKSASKPRGIMRKLTFVPARQDYTERRQLHISGQILHVYLDPAILDVQTRFSRPSPVGAGALLEDDALRSTIDKIRTLAETPRAGGSAYLGALAVVLMHELAGLYRSVDGGEGPARGGLAAWQERLVSGYIDEHVNEHIPLAALARLARLSPYHFSRAFKQSFGVPPHRYHTQRRIERAKALLESHTLSVTEIGLALGFSETSSFTAAFRKITGLTPTRYHRSVAYQPAQR